MEITNGTHLVLWDGECNFCRRVSYWVQRANRDRSLQTCPYQECPWPPMTPELASACEKAVHVLTADGRTLRAGRAALFILKRCGFGFIARLLRLPPFIWGVEIAYRIVAGHRDFFARFLFIHEETPAGL